MRGPNVNQNLTRLTITSMAAALLVFGSVGPVAGTTPGEASLVKDISTSGDGSGSSFPSALTDASGTLFFSAKGPGGRELYSTDGTEAGTIRLSIRPGAKGSSPADLTALGARVFFSAHDGASGRELWTSDGTPGGTMRVKDIRPGAKGSNPLGLATMGNKLYFSANNGQFGRELWVSDGTAQGTRMVRDIKQGAKGSDPQELVAVGSKLFFTALGSRALWVSDGSSAGTTAFPNSSGMFDNRQLTRAGNQLFFVGTHAPDSHMPMTSLRVIRPGATRSVKLLEVSSENCPNPSYCDERLDLVPVGSMLFVTGPTRRLWRTDGTSAGTVKLMKLNDCGSKAGRYPECSYAGAYTDVAGRLFFVLPQYVYSAEHEAYRPDSDQVWTSDGTVAGTRVVKVFDQPSTGGWNAPGGAVALDGAYYFTGYDADSGFELWRSDGTTAGTILACDINLFGFDNGWALPHHMAAAGSSLYMSADDGVHGFELWRYQP